MNCEFCRDLKKQCLMCYDMECGITNLQKSIGRLEEKLSKQKLKLRDMIELQKPNRVQPLNEYIALTK